MKNNKPLYLFVGKSASGKTTVANMLENDGYSQVKSYTTRPKRYEGEEGHIFISDKVPYNIKNIMASTTYNGYWYCATLDQIQKADIYVIDPDVAKELMRNKSKLNRDIHVLYFEVNQHNRIKRMKKRGDGIANIAKRILNDDSSNWIIKLIEIYDQYDDDDLESDIAIFIIDANKSLCEVYEYVKDYMAFVIEHTNKNVE